MPTNQTSSHKPARWRAKAAIAAAAAATVALGLATVPALASAALAATPVITSVIFSSGSAQGSPTPLVTINGSGFGHLPQPVPSGNPQDYLGSGCFGVTPGYDGLDFGSSLWFSDNGLFQAGFGQSSGGNCIGLVIWKYSSTQIQYGFGVVYGGTLQIHSGDSYTVNVRGVRESGTVTFSS
jgi:hypothetical protein